MRKTLIGLLAGATALAAAGQAAADPRGRYYDHHRHHEGRRNDDGAAVAAGIVGLALGAALASGSDRSDRAYGYYQPGYGYDDGPRYYRAPPRAYYRSYRSCRTDRYWDGYGYVERTRCW